MLRKKPTWSLWYKEEFVDYFYDRKDAITYLKSLKENETIDFEASDENHFYTKDDIEKENSASYELWEDEENDLW